MRIVSCNTPTLLCVPGPQWKLSIAEIGVQELEGSYTAHHDRSLCHDASHGHTGEQQA